MQSDASHKTFTVGPFKNQKEKEKGKGKSN